MTKLMKGTNGIVGILILLILISCSKEYSLENGGNVGNPLVVGTDCRISKIVSNDSASGLALSSIGAVIDLNDKVSNITHFDSLGNNLLFSSSPLYAADTIFIDQDEYFITDPATGHISKLHGLYDPTNLASEFDVDYLYDASGYLVLKTYSLSMFPGFPVIQVEYTYSGGNLVHMVSTDLTVPELISDADITYYTNITPQHYMYIFPDEGDNADFNHFAPFNQFYDFGKKPLNAVKSMTVRSYDFGNVLKDSAVSTFNSYILSQDKYVLSVYMLGDDQPSIPAEAGKLTFSYKCK